MDPMELEAVEHKTTDDCSLNCNSKENKTPPNVAVGGASANSVEKKTVEHILTQQSPSNSTVAHVLSTPPDSLHHDPSFSEGRTRVPQTPILTPPAGFQADVNLIRCDGLTSPSPPPPPPPLALSPIAEDVCNEGSATRLSESARENGVAAGVSSERVQTDDSIPSTTATATTPTTASPRQCATIRGTGGEVRLQQQQTCSNASRRQPNASMGEPECVEGGPSSGQLAQKSNDVRAGKTAQVASSTGCNRNSCSSCAANEDYRALYHEAVQKVHLQAVELEGFRSLMSEVCRFSKLKDKWLFGMETASLELQSARDASQKKLQGWEAEKSAIRRICEDSLAVATMEAAIASAQCVLLEEKLAEKEKILCDTVEKLAASENEVKLTRAQLSRLQDKLRKEKQQLDSVTVESEELVEFAKCEQKALEETVLDLQRQVKIQAARDGDLSEEVETLKCLLRSEYLKSLHYQTVSERAMGQLEKMSCSSSSGADKENQPGSEQGSSGELKKVLAQWRHMSAQSSSSCSSGGLPSDLKEEVRQRALLENKVCDLSEKFRKCLAEYSRVQQSFKDYQVKASEKIAILKSNLAKADSEISELDDLIDRVVSVMKSNYSFLKTCPPLLKVLQNLMGSSSS